MKNYIRIMALLLCLTTIMTGFSLNCFAATPKTAQEIIETNAFPEIMFIQFKEYMYVNRDNVTIYKDINSPSATMKLSYHTIVYCIGRSSAAYGWSKIIYNKQVYYIRTAYLSQGSRTILQEMKNRSFMIGRLTSPELGLNVALIEGSLYNKEPYTDSQIIVDTRDSAVYLSDAVNYYGQIVIADHNHQGFDVIMDAKPGTLAYIDYGFYTQTLKCVDKFIGYNTGTEIVDRNKQPLKGQNPGGICMYTCNYDEITITITYWELV